MEAFRNFPKKAPTVCKHNHPIKNKHIIYANAEGKCVWNEKTEQYDHYELEVPEGGWPAWTAEMLRSEAMGEEADERNEEMKEETPEESSEEKGSDDKDMEPTFVQELDEDSKELEIQNLEDSVDVV